VFHEVEAPRFQDNRHMKVVRLSALSTGHLYPQKTFLVLNSVRVWVDPRTIVRPEGLRQLKIPVTPSEINPATFRFVAQCLNHCATSCPIIFLRALFFLDYVCSSDEVYQSNLGWQFLLRCHPLPLSVVQNYVRRKLPLWTLPIVGFVLLK
jgi:hypothetical protein